MRHRYFYIIQLALIFLLPISVFAQTGCSDVGYTILTINGILTNEREAQDNKEKLEKFLGDGIFNEEPIIVDFLYNPSHLAGVGDMVKTLKQIMANGQSVDDYDLREMLRAASEKVKTRKVLLVGHSQGNFYANGIYDVLTSPLEGSAASKASGRDVSLAVFAVATPAARVAGEGEYITSSNDKVITELAAGVADAFSAKILPANTTISNIEGDTSDGHSFSGVYLRERGAEIVAGLEHALGKLHSESPNTTTPSRLRSGHPSSTEEGIEGNCIPSQPSTIAHKLQGAMYAVVDPVANDLRSNIATAAENIAGIARAVAKVADKVLSSKPIIYESSGANIGAVAVIAEIEPPPLPPTPSPKERESKENKNNPEPSPLGREKGGVKKQDLTRSQVLENLKTNSLLEESVAGKASERDVLPVFDPIPIPTGIPGFGGGGGGGGATHSNVLQNTAIENNTQETPDVEEPAEPPAAPTYSSPNAGDIVINEIAWSGTEASAADEWIELYNRTANTISLASTTLFASDGSPYIKLSGTIGPRAYYLIEADESAISDITADLVASFGTRLSDTTGESLTLAHFDGSATTTIDALDDFSCINWCGYGGGAYYLSMERISPGLPGTEQASWGINRGYQNGMRNGADRNGAVMNGTPKQRNYSSYLVNNGNYNLTSGTLVLTAAGSPYFIDSAWFTVGQGATLTAEAGAVVKFWNQAGIRVNGTLNINGSASTSTVFTSYADDEYGGDLNKDETRTSPVAGNWFGIEFLPGSSGNINYATLRYGGKYYNQDGYTRAILSANESSPSITNSIVEKSMGYGILLAYASSTVSNNIIKDNYFENDTSNSYGLYGYGGAPNISNNIFSGNYRGLYFYDLLNATFSNNTFINNISFGFATST